MSFFYHTASAATDPKSEQTALPVEFQILQEILEKQSGKATAVVSMSTPTKGIHLTIYTTVRQASRESKAFCIISLITLTALPCYSGTGGYTVQYDYYADNHLQKSYRYDITLQAMTWIGLLPFSWLNFLMTDYKEAFEATVYQFVHDSRSDGLL